MRISVRPDDPGHHLYCQLIGRHGRPTIGVRVDGVEVHRVVTADIDEGAVMAHAVDETGESYVDPTTRQMAMVEHHGRVEIVLSKGGG